MISLFLLCSLQGMIAEPIPDWLEVYMNRVNSIKGIFGEETKANHVLVNEYLPGNGILPHLDGPLFYPVISTISLGSGISLDFYNPIDNTKSCDSIQFHDRYQFSIYVQPRSLLVLSDQLYDKVCYPMREYMGLYYNFKPIKKLYSTLRLYLSISME